MSIVEQSGVTVQFNDQGFVNATRLCAAGNKLWANYKQNAGTSAYLVELSASIDIPIEDLIIQNAHGDINSRHTWVHQRIAIHLAYWISPKFAVWVTDIVERHLCGELVPVQQRTLQSYTGVQDWTKPQFYMSLLKGDNWDHLMYSDGAHRALTRGERVALFIIKFGCKKEVCRWSLCSAPSSHPPVLTAAVTQGVRHTTHLREFGGDYQLLDTFLTAFPVEVETRMRNWARARGVLLEGRHNKRESKDCELLGIMDEETYREVCEAAQGFVKEVDDEMRALLGIDANVEPLEVQLERVRQAEQTKRHVETELTKRLQIRADIEMAEIQAGKPPATAGRAAQPALADSASEQRPTRTHSSTSAKRARGQIASQCAGEPISFQIPAHASKCQPVYQHKTNGEFVAYHTSGAAAVKCSKLEGDINQGIRLDVASISECANGKRSSHAGFKWRMVPEAEWQLETISTTRNTCGRIIQVGRDGIVVNRYGTMEEAAEIVKQSITTIRTAIRKGTFCQLHLWQVDAAVAPTRRPLRLEA